MNMMKAINENNHENFQNMVLLVLFDTLTSYFKIKNDLLNYMPSLVYKLFY